jgi:hypothetical protein
MNKVVNIYKTRFKRRKLRQMGLPHGAAVSLGTAADSLKGG